MKAHIRSLLEHALSALRDEGELALDSLPEIPVERSRGDDHGDFASPVALGLARIARRSPREIAERIVARLPESASIASVAIAGPGFINFGVAKEAFAAVVREILASGAKSAHPAFGHRRRIQVEFVSANPTGPLHVGHGRGAAYGASLANILEAAGFDVEREYYINDAGRQMHILALSVWLRYLERLGSAIEFPSNGYRGEYIHEIAADLERGVGADLAVDAGTLMNGVPADQPAGGDKEAHVDALIARARSLLGPQRYQRVFALARDMGVDDIRSDLEEFGVVFDEWFSERTLVDAGDVGRVVKRLRERGHVYERDGALWFRSTAFGDEKDRVVVRENGESTYFASDIAYAANKFDRGFERAIYVWGADHHGYIARVKAAVEALGYDSSAVEILIVQFANLYRGGERAQMSTRSGEFVALRELRNEVGADAARFFYVMRRCEQHLDFDLELAKSRSNDNPVYYVQYAHARIASVLRQCAERGMDAHVGPEAALDALVEDEPIALMRELARYAEVLASSAQALEPHQVAAYLREVATRLHGFYNAHTFLVDDDAVRGARLSLAVATQAVLADGLALLGVSAPNSM
ncbi:MAG: arginine--tRNA ligase [Thiotrichales bacterium]|nr:arginine--tRNA ligase [Thiotrichales bacterium]